jgi:entericidin A
MMNRTLKLLVLLLLTGSVLTGCNTARGVGEDIKDLGHIISHAAS